jgi:CRP-like cAMP-binding protein
MSREHVADLGGVSVGRTRPVAIMGVINVSPESFHAGSVRRHADVLATALTMVEAGAALIDVGARSATVSAKTDVVCFGLTYWEFRPLVQQHATLAWNLLQEFAKRLRSAQEG